MDDVFVYLRDDMPITQAEYVTPCLHGYTIYINAKLDTAHQQEAYEHALEHIRCGDFDIDCVKDIQQIEAEAHGIDLPVKDFEKKLLTKKRRKSAKIKFLESIGHDFFASAEREWLEPR